jgi:hypothetical protein
MKLSAKLNLLLETLPIQKELQLINKELNNPNKTNLSLITLSNRVSILLQLFPKQKSKLIQKEKQIDKELRKSV